MRVLVRRLLRRLWRSGSCKKACGSACDTIIMLGGAVAKLSEPTAPLQSKPSGYTFKRYHHTTTAALRQHSLTIELLISRHPIIQHRLHNQTMPIPRLRTPLRLIIQPIRPKMAPTTTDLRTRTIPTPQQRQGLRPIPTGAPIIKSLPLADTKRVRDLVQRGSLGLVRGVGAEAQVAVVVCFRGGHAGGVVDADGFGYGGREALVAGYGGGHGGVDAGVGCGLVGGWVGGSL